MAADNAPRFRPPRRELVPFLVVAFIGLLTLASAGANLVGAHPRPSAAELMKEELGTVADARRVRITELRALGLDCAPVTAHELARLLAQDGRFADARTYADTYETVCGADPVVRHWGDAPAPRARRSM